MARLGSRKRPAIVRVHTMDEAAMIAPYSYINRKSVVYYLHRARTRAGKTRFVMKRTLGEGALGAVPDGYEVVENVNGQVAVRRIPPRLISEIEEEAVRAALVRHGREEYRFEIRRRQIVIYKPDTDAAEFAARASRLVPPYRREAVERKLFLEAARQMSYSPVLRFTLTHERKRAFRTERMCYRSFVDGWLHIADPAPLRRALYACVPHLGKESFFGLWYGEVDQL